MSDQEATEEAGGELDIMAPQDDEFNFADEISPTVDADKKTSRAKRNSKAAAAKAGSKDTKTPKLVKTPKAKASNQPITEANAVAIAVDGTGAATKATNGTTKTKKTVKRSTKKTPTGKKSGKTSTKKSSAPKEEKEITTDEVDVTGGDSTAEAEMAETEEAAEEPEPEPERRQSKRRSRKQEAKEEEVEQDEEEPKDQDQVEEEEESYTAMTAAGHSVPFYETETDDLRPPGTDHKSKHHLLLTPVGKEMQAVWMQNRLQRKSLILQRRRLKMMMRMSQILMIMTPAEASTSSSSSSSSASSRSSRSHDSKEKRKRKRRPRRKRQISPIVFGQGVEKPEEKTSSDSSDSGEESKKAKMPSSVKAVRKDQTSKLKYLFRDARYFLIKSNNHENVALAKAKGVWSTLPNNEHRLTQAFRESRNVLLIFSVKESGKFQGYARMRTESRHDGPTMNWVLPHGMSRSVLGGVMKLDWITRHELPFPKCVQLFNAWNDNKPVKIGRDGQEIEPKCGEAVCRMFPPDEAIDVVEILRDARRRRREQAMHGGPSSASSSRRDHPMSAAPPRRRRPDYIEPRRGRGRPDSGRDHPYYMEKRRPRGRPPPYHDGPRDVLINGSYSDYIREYQAHTGARHLPPMPLPGFSHQPPYQMDSMPPPPHHFPPPHHHQGRMPPPPHLPRHGDYPPQLMSRSGRERERERHDRERARERSRDRRDRDRERRLSYESRLARDCDEFVRRTSAPSSRDRDRERERDRERRERRRHERR
ncbi:LOW QUALITY PROTEIN: uncharacterized protein [Amphiura filiformis]|uniref:LOW QUALITY PROTEIN: uncharacterized protein n=1 Tax=Amphiura filiformis TaxID=82378 RepID=UPI003B228609